MNGILKVKQNYESVAAGLTAFLHNQSFLIFVLTFLLTVCDIKSLPLRIFSITIISYQTNFILVAMPPKKFKEPTILAQKVNRISFFTTLNYIDIFVLKLCLSNCF